MVGKGLVKFKQFFGTGKDQFSGFVAKKYWAAGLFTDLEGQKYDLVSEPSKFEVSLIFVDSKNRVLTFSSTKTPEILKLSTKKAELFIKYLTFS